MSLKVYLASPWVNKADALEAKAKFEAAGIEVTSHWITREFQGDANDIWNPANSDELTSEAMEDVQDIVQSDVFVILNLGKSEGKATEFGMAYSLGIPTILVGKRDTNIFYYLPNVFRADTVEHAIEGIQTAAARQEEPKEPSLIEVVN